MVDENGAMNEQSATYDGKEYQVIREGLAGILKPQSTTEQNGGGSKSQTVFYNPIQQFNRDLSVIAMRAFAEDLAIIRKRRKERASGKAKQRGNKRKRSLEDQGRKASLDSEQQTNAILEQPDTNSNDVEKVGFPTGKSCAPI